MRGEGTPLRELLGERKLSVADLTRLSGMSYPRVWQAVAGYQCSRETAAKLGETLGVDPELIRGRRS